MTVKEMIEYLQSLAPTTEVVVTTDFGQAYTPELRGVETFFNEDTGEEFQAAGLCMEEYRGQG